MMMMAVWFDMIYYAGDAGCSGWSHGFLGSQGLSLWFNHHIRMTMDGVEDMVKCFWPCCYIEKLVITMNLVMMRMLTWDVLNTSSVWDDKAIELRWKGDWNLNVNMRRIQTSLCYQRHFTIVAVVPLSSGFHFRYFTFRISSQWEISSISGRR